ncbi:MAG TPA: hypothetical protein VGS27_19060 [Candidatus Sulfotelmatobacter sp.]|nr:hypothetical protein [Candidatus Sulfotelmatobacter sp.]
MKLLKLILRRGCTHRFSWPRMDEQGRHYQVCLACGTVYEYDWTLMRQTGRLLLTGQHGFDVGNVPH